MSQPVEDLTDAEVANIVASEDTSHSRRRQAWDELLARGYSHPDEVDDS